MQLGRARAIVFATGTATSMDRINDALAASVEAHTPLKQKLDEFGALLSKVIAVVCVAVWVVNIGAFSDPAHGGWFKGALYYFKVAVALAVAAIPEGLPAVVTTCLALGTRKMAAKRAIVRSLPSVETLGCTTVICVDKTGTLTSNAMAAVRAAVPTAAGITAYTLPAPHVAAVGRVCAAESGQALPDATEVQGLLYLALCASVCNDSTLARTGVDGAMGQNVGDSTDIALRLFAERIGLPPSVPAVRPFLLPAHWSRARLCGTATVPPTALHKLDCWTGCVITTTCRGLSAQCVWLLGTRPTLTGTCNAESAFCHCSVFMHVPDLIFGNNHAATAL